MRAKLQGIIPPIITPLAEPDRLDRAALARLIERLVTAGVSGIFPLGTTGEGPTLSGRLQREVIDATCELVDGRVPVLVGVTHSAMGESHALAEHALAAGADAIVAAPLLYFAPRPADVTAYFEQLAEASPLPLVLYDMPACVRADITYESAEALTHIENIIGIKDSSGDFARFRRLLSLRALRPDWTFLIGPELLTAEAIVAGGDGGVAGGANLEPELFVQLAKAAQARDVARVDQLLAAARQIGELYKLSDDALGVTRGLKAALALRCECNDLLAVPYATPVDEAFRARVGAILRRITSPIAVSNDQVGQSC
ncbi:MAG: dihydrodipicolinate synthase family protein [Planctomycetes bacterium]|nr:dihydrodipicolinate synthase family protein [Planctomycetota bacterium]